MTPSELNEALRKAPLTRSEREFVRYFIAGNTSGEMDGRLRIAAEYARECVRRKLSEKAYAALIERHRTARVQLLKRRHSESLDPYQTDRALCDVIELYKAELVKHRIPLPAA